MRLGILCLIAALAAAALSQGRPIKGGDRLRVSCEQEPTLNRTVALSSEGVGSFGILGLVALDGKSTQEAGRELEILLLRKLPLDQATVHVLLLERDDLPVRFGGAVGNSGEVEATASLRLAEVVQLARPTTAANLEAVEIFRDDGSRVLADWTSGENPRLRPGDRVFFPLATGPRDVFVLGGVYSPRNVPHAEAKTVRLAIEMCGGLSPHANRRDITVEREGRTVARIRWEQDGGLSLQPGDTVRIGVIDERVFVTVSGAVRRPGRVAFYRGMDIREVLAEVGGLAPDADLERALVRAGTGSLRAGDGRVFESGFVLTSGDRIEVPRVTAGSRASLLGRIVIAIGRVAG